MTIDLHDWFVAFTTDLRGDVVRRRELLEVLSDSANEFFCNAITAMHLRRYGRGFAADRLFWVRSEWEKTDLSYGIAKTRFADWNSAWPGETGDLGQLEAKVLYAHWSLGQMRPRVLELRSALAARRSRDLLRQGAVYVQLQRYHGLVWLFDDARHAERNGADAEQRATDLLNGAFAELVPFVVVAREDMKGFWPLTSHERSYVPELRVALARLP